MPNFSRNTIKEMTNRYKDQLHNNESSMSEKMELRFKLFDYANNIENEAEKEEYKKMLMEDSFGISPEGEINYDAAKQFIMDLGTYSADQSVDYLNNIKNNSDYLSGEGLYKLNRIYDYLSALKAFAMSDDFKKYNESIQNDKENKDNVITPGIVTEWFDEGEAKQYRMFWADKNNILKDSDNIQGKALQEINLSETELEKKQEEAGKSYLDSLVRDMSIDLEKKYAEIEKSGVAAGNKPKNENKFEDINKIEEPENNFININEIDDDNNIHNEDKVKTAGQDILDRIQKIRNDVSQLKPNNTNKFIDNQKNELEVEMIGIRLAKKRNHQNSQDYFQPVEEALTNIIDFKFENAVPTEFEVKRTLMEKYDEFITAADRYINHYDWGFFNFL
ncbi:MAG: hypothetical protein K6A23_07675, partial [Butyrivibrio sp.]|nr:hypothetical protein [Butyrivibrio sp.]